TQGSFVATLPDILCSEDLSYPICSRRRLLHLFAGIVPPAAFVLSVKSTLWFSFEDIYRDVLLHEAIFLVHHHCRISSNKQRHLPYPISSKFFMTQCLSRCPSDLPITLAVAVSPPLKSTAVRPSRSLITQ
ncbi:hypothetical protein B296_00040005, partial [Ensete ventricosum]